MSTVEKGQTVSVHYVGTFEDGTQFDNSYDRGDALSFEVGSGQMIKGFDAALPGMTVGEKKEITIPSVDAYGDVVTESFQAAPFTSFPEDFDFVVGNTVYGKTGEGQDFSARIHEVGDDSVMLDFNHPLAGKSLTFEIELVSID
jgi:peptidylprolyl isomerase